MKRFSRAVSVLALFCVLLLLVTGCAGLFGSGGSSRGEKDKASNVAASISQDGSAWIPCKNYAPAIHIKGDIREAYLCADEKHIVVLEENGDLYTVKPGRLEERTAIAEDVQSLEVIRSEGVFYTILADEETVYVRHLFSNSSNAESDIASFTAATDTCSILYVTPDGAVMVFAADSEQPEEIARYSEAVVPVAVSNDGSACVFNVTEGSTVTTYLCDAGECQKLDSVDSEYNNTKTYFSQDEQLLAIYNTEGTLLYLRKPGEDIVKIKLPTAPSWEEPMTKSGALGMGPAADTLYMFTETDDYGLLDVYAIDVDGGREKVLSNVRTALFADGRVYYTDEEFILYGADMNGSTIENESKISSNVYSLLASPDGKNICYSKSITEDEVGSLYIYSSQKDESTRVSTNASFMYIDLPSINSYYVYDYSKFSSDGKYLYYYEDVDSIGESASSKGTLRRFSLANEETKTILMDSLVYIGTGNYSNTVNSNYFWGGTVFLRRQHRGLAAISSCLSRAKKPTSHRISSTKKANAKKDNAKIADTRKLIRKS